MPLLHFPKSLINRAGTAWMRRALHREAAHSTFRRHNERAVEYAFIFRQVARLCPKTILDVGTGTSALPSLLRTCGPLVTASDNVKDYWPAGMFNRHFHVIDDDIRATQLQAGFDMITCVSVLEHITDFPQAVREMFRLLNPGGRLLLTCPYTDHQFVENVYQLEGARAEYQDVPYICRSYSHAELNGWLTDSSATIEDQEFWQIESGEFHALGEWLHPARQVTQHQLHQLTCLALRKPR
jgi:2-polyprenyl-3-methyl-5-hydroxy-6-metoxy-1,4-benzoquinol methylase